MDFRKRQEEIKRKLVEEQKALGNKINQSLADRKRKQDDMINRLSENQQKFVDPFFKSFK